MKVDRKNGAGAQFKGGERYLRNWLVVLLPGLQEISKDLRTLRDATDRKSEGVAACWR